MMTRNERGIQERIFLSEAFFLLGDCFQECFSFEKLFSTDFIKVLNHRCRFDFSKFAISYSS